MIILCQVGSLILTNVPICCKMVMVGKARGVWYILPVQFFAMNLKLFLKKLKTIRQILLFENAILAVGE